MMKSSEVVMAILKSEGRSKRSLALEIGITPQALDSRLSTSPRIDTLTNTLKPLGYEVFAVPTGTQIVDGYKLES